MSNHDDDDDYISGPDEAFTDQPIAQQEESQGCDKEQIWTALRDLSACYSIGVRFPNDPHMLEELEKIAQASWVEIERLGGTIYFGQIQISNHPKDPMAEQRTLGGMPHVQCPDGTVINCPMSSIQLYASQFVEKLR